ncbi:putative ferric-chelate reductase 1 [Protopterus annectens]|uniref:putative ferric-chelate reductase 1 n=1 Tax=Protopterus annectens TaxID=7888 RepID=UPI001CFA53E9|nr:putative ferric-chelate reductase 1 [Protopterus annectens]XP_043941543.1 putative ferric-chelate reductase 1 [Protopterus annectens]
MENLSGYLLFCILTVVGNVSGYPNGQVSSSCISMQPSHGVNAQTSTPPYSIIVQKTNYSAGDNITVTIQGNNIQTFKGFLVRTRTASNDAPIGTFISTDSSAQAISCSSLLDGAASHTSNLAKQKVEVQWLAPQSSEDVQFKVTVVQSRNIFWSSILGPTLKSTRQGGSPNISTTTSSGSLQTQSKPSAADLISRDGCSTSKFCFTSPSGCDPLSDSSCYFMSSAAVDTDGLRIEISGPSTGYMAVGFSDDQKMGSDDIYTCLHDNGRIIIQHSYSTGRSPPTVLTLNNVDNITTSFNNGVIKCSFITRNQISTQQRAFTDMYYIFLAQGPVESGNIRIHSQIPFITASKVNITGFQESSSNSNGRPSAIKAHGALMLISWMTTASIGMLIARYFKEAAKELVGGKAIWFQAHLSLMVLTVITTAIAFIVAFAEVQGWSYNRGAHPVLGCIVMALAVIQPFVAIFRPAPQSKRRPIFYWFHALNAQVIKVLAVATIFLGLQLIDSSSNMWLAKVMGGFVGWEVLMFILLDTDVICKKKEIYQEPEKTIKNEILLLIIYVCGNLAFLIALLVGIGQS